MNFTETRSIDASDSDVLAALRTATTRIPPLYDLENFVAVNPFVGWAGVPLAEASPRIAAGLASDVLPQFVHYHQLWTSGEIGMDSLEAAAKRHGLNPEILLAALQLHESVHEVSVNPVTTAAERVLRETGVDLPKVLSRFLSRNLADLLAGEPPMSPDALFQELIERASVDKSFEIAGVHGWNAWMVGAPHSLEESLAGVPPASEEHLEGKLYGLLGSLYGWASYLRGIDMRSCKIEPGLTGALAMALLEFDQAIANLLSAKVGSPKFTATGIEDPHLRECLQDAYEDELIGSQLGGLHDPCDVGQADSPDIQVLCCIDVRSEVLRRKLEALSPRLETVGFAGFFGVAVDYVRYDHSSARCPVLLKPQIELVSKQNLDADRLKLASRAALASPGAFNLVEAIGLGFMGSLLAKAFGYWRSKPSELADDLGYAQHYFGLTLAERVSIAASILTNSGIASRLGKLVVLCGHGGSSANNSHAASLDCGACGGHCGALNAQMAAEILNDSEVRRQLQLRGFSHISDSFFLGAQHDTSTDEITIFQSIAVQDTHSGLLQDLMDILPAASNAVREDRSRALGYQNLSGNGLLSRLNHRSRDWSEVRPEWGLARNSTFLAARRSRSRGVDLQGRVFLHDYDVSQDADGEILKLILAAPVVVASWINWQYFASTVNNERFGCGTKAVLNRVGKIGVITGNEGDLRPGLPVESVHRPDGGWFHDPVRLQVVIEASTNQIDHALSQVPEVSALVQNGWIRLLSLSPEASKLLLKCPNGGWEPIAKD